MRWLPPGMITTSVASEHQFPMITRAESPATTCTNAGGAYEWRPTISMPCCFNQATEPNVGGISLVSRLFARRACVRKLRGFSGLSSRMVGFTPVPLTSESDSGKPDIRQSADPGAPQPSDRSTVPDAWSSARTRSESPLDRQIRQQRQLRQTGQWVIATEHRLDIGDPQRPRVRPPVECSLR